MDRGKEVIILKIGNDVKGSQQLKSMVLRKNNFVFLSKIVKSKRRIITLLEAFQIVGHFIVRRLPEGNLVHLDYSFLSFPILSPPPFGVQTTKTISQIFSCKRLI